MGKSSLMEVGGMLQSILSKNLGPFAASTKFTKAQESEGILVVTFQGR